MRPSGTPRQDQIMATNSSKKADHTRQAIVAAALEAFATHGYALASIHTIATTTQVAKPVLYYHYGSRRGCFGRWSAR